LFPSRRLGKEACWISSND